MAKEQGKRAGEHGFSIDLDESLIADALAAVERRLDGEEELARPGGEEPEGTGEPGPDELLAGGAWDEDSEEIIFAMGPASGPLPAPEADEVPSREQLLTLNAQLEEELEGLEAERDRLAEEVDAQRGRADTLCAERDEARERARDALRKAGLLVVKARRKDERLEQLRLDLQDARDMLRQRDQALRELRDALREAERERERLRSRHSRETAESKRFANERLLRNLLPVLDHMELALAHAEADPDRIREGVDITWKQLLAVLERAGLARVALSEGDAFDPELQEAMEYVERAGIPANHVVQIHQHGYLLSGRLLRAARVAVSSAGGLEPPGAPADGAPSEE